MISFKSIFSRIIFLHVIALVITAIFMPVVLYYFFKWAANDLHDQAMREQADLVAHYLVLRPDGSWTLDLPPALQDVYSQAVGRYAYAPGMFVDGRFVRGKIDAVHLVAGYVTMKPLNLGTHAFQHTDGLLGDFPQLGVG